MGDAQRAENAPPAHEEPDEAQEADAGTNDDESPGSETDEGTEVSKLRKEAARYRTEKKAETERADAAEARAAAVLDHVLAAECKTYGIAPRALTLAEKDPAAWFGKDGFDRQALVADIREVAAMFGARKPGVSPYAGTGGERPTSRTWGDALKQG